MAISEKITLLGKGLYKDIPDELTLKSIPTASELDYVGGEDFQATLLDVIFPKAIEEQVDFRQLLEIDFQWICRCLRILNYGPYYTTNAIYCPDCGLSSGEYQVDLRNIEVKPLPEGFNNSIVISKNEFVDFDGDIVLHLPTIQEAMNSAKDSMFKDSKGESNQGFAHLCYMITSIGGKDKLAVPVIKNIIQNDLSPADFIILRERSRELTNFGLRAGGNVGCPRCGSKEAAFMALVDDRFFRPTLGDLRSWKIDRDAEKSSGSVKGDNLGGERVKDVPTDASVKV